MRVSSIPRGLVLAMIALITLGAATVGAAITPYDCDGQPTTANSCPPDSKYSRARLNYSFSGSGMSTDWTISQRLHGGSTGGNVGTYEGWRPSKVQDWKHTGSWVFIAEVNSGSGWLTNTSWSADATMGSQRNVLDAQAVSILTYIEQRRCVWTYIPPNYICTGSDTHMDIQDNQAWN